jgi:hypothetical protein
MVEDATEAPVDPSDSAAFTDTCVLLNYVQRGLETDYTSWLVDGDAIDVVVGVTVAEELDDVTERRKHIYSDFVDYLVDEDGDVSTYDPTQRRPYFQQNDLRHLREIQMRLAKLEGRAESQVEVRRLTRMFRRRFEHLQEDVVPDAMFDAQPGLTLLFALDDVISNDNDRNVVADAALWVAEGEHGSDLFVTMDQADLLAVADEINATLRESKDSAWELRMLHPRDLADRVRSDPTTQH